MLLVVRRRRSRVAALAIPLGVVGGIAMTGACSSSSPSDGGSAAVDGDSGAAGSSDGTVGASAHDATTTATGSDSTTPAGEDDGAAVRGGDAATPTESGTVRGPPASGSGGAACPSLTGPADEAYPRWPMPNPPASNLPNPFTYTDNGDGTVSDHVTGLVWQKAVTASATFAAAPAYCAGLTLPAPTGTTWQVPTRIQLLSIVDYTTGAAVDAPFLASGQPPGGKYTWTSTPWVVSQIATKPQDAWMVNFGGGGGLTSNAASQTATEWVRCVAAPAVTPLPYPHYVQVDTGEVEDVETHLVWAQASYSTVLTQAAAAAYCASLPLNGHKWRLPSVNELASLVDDNPNISKVSPAIDQCVFSDTSANAYYISSSAWGTTPWGLNYEDGFDFNTEPQLPDAGQGMPGGYVKCVR
jgi:Protein of unknown function (DUF1566)